ncbi:hypothetical protein ACFWJT_29840 [Streptomyces sp. NPDC127069]|uniref:hypothetical protein n=1 Tax=Streptomyces sp. NPDC127069 TaxID=3347128 RepID=UPI003669EAE9
MTKPLPRQTPVGRRLAQQQRTDDASGRAFTGTSYGRPSQALMARATRGWQKLGALHGSGLPGHSSIGLPGLPRKPGAVDVGPSANLLDRALVGWERFLSTSPAVTDE